MGRRKTTTIAIRELKCFPTILKELQTLPGFADYEIKEGIICLKGKKAPAFILDVDKAISNLKRYQLVNQHLIPTLGQHQIIRRVRLAKILGISRPTLNQWIANNFISPLIVPNIPGEIFPLDKVLSQLIFYKKNNK